ncbi:diaminopimelate epimerase [Buchnera aphidicola (Melanaphis sacchari)]|uniref:Diaminopimelate epimerase n=1 Tax=Buchnera aphidicola (Melanaphis sacchari) TaxID=2173854 RepID=A0A2U8DEF2_9GAMM|nr:diaminopimelate epimerase [Buchnera aphidicola]AWH90239.1 diaminopimelate epimerase [Buchnera aphidicola (Melanaphis sacchari)]
MFLRNKNKKKIKFSKMHGLGNDFMVVELINQDFIFSPDIIKKLSHRNTGIGFDQLLLVEKSYNIEFDFHYRIFNSNGSEVEQCGNGARCIGLFLLLKGLTNKKKVIVSTKKNNIIINFLSNNLIQVNMGQPNFKIDQISTLNKKTCNDFSTKLLNKSLLCNLVSIGNPHCIIQVQSIKYAPVKKIARKIEKSLIFPKGINVSFMEIINKNHIKLRVHERDVGETQSCGSGACAAVAVGIAKNLLSNNVKVNLLGGSLTINWKGFQKPLYMTGSANHVFDGYIYI